MSFVATIEADVNKWGPNLKKAEKDVNNFATKAKRDFDSLSNAQKRSSSVAMEFNRIIQDAPFGMMGISNNLTQLTDNYKNYASSVRQAAAEQGKSITNFQILKGAIGGIFSPLNLLSLGLAAVTSGWIIYTQWQQKAKKANAETSDSLTKLVENLSGTSKLLYDAAKASGQEIAQLRVLYNITQDVNQSTSDRKEAAKKLIDQYPELFKKFNTEQIMLGQAKGAYDKLSTSILATARAQAAYGAIGEKASKQIAIDETNKDLQKQIALIDTRIKQQEYLVNELGKSTTATGEAAESGRVSRLNDLYDQRNKLLGDQTSNLLERAKLQEEINDLESVAVVNQNNTIAVTGKAAAAQKDYARELIESLAKMGYYDAALASIGYKYKDLSKLAKQAGADAVALGRIAREELGEKLTLALGQADGFKPITPTLNIVPKVVIPDTLPGLEQAQQKIAETGRKLKYTFENALTIDIGSILGEMGGNAMEALGQALANGTNVIDAIGKSLLSTLGSIAVEVGKTMIAMGTAGIALKKLVLNPFLAVAAGAALVALGSFASASVNRTVTSGGVSSGGSGYSSSVSNQDYSQFRGALYNNDKQVVELNIKGNNLVGAFKINQNRNTRLG